MPPGGHAEVSGASPRAPAPTLHSQSDVKTEGPFAPSPKATLAREPRGRAVSNRDRQRKIRERRRAGRVVLAIEVDPVALAALLVAGGYMSPVANDDEPASLVPPVEQLLRDLTASEVE